MAMDKNYQEVEIFLSGHDLPKLDTFSKSDPFLVVYMKSGYGKQWREVGRTETIMDNHFPIFEKRFNVNYIFEQEQNIRIDAYDEDKKNARSLESHDYVGSVDFVLGEIVHYPGGTMRKVLVATRGNRKGKKVRNTNSKKYTTITIKVEEIEQCNHLIHLNLGASKLPKMDWFGSGDPFLEFFRMGQGDSTSNSMAKVFSTEVLKNNSNPVWKPIRMEVARLCNGDFDRPLVIKCQDWNSNGKSDFIGEIQTSLNELIKMQGQSVPFTRPKKPGKKFGTLNVQRSFLQERYTFVEYLRGGLDMRLLLAIDFTGSNGHYLDIGTLHYIRKETGTSKYMDAISEVGSIVEVYNENKIFSCWGFGAILGHGRVTQHCFPLTLTNDPNVKGTGGVLTAYKNALLSKQLNFSGPTLFEHIIKAAKVIASESTPKKQVYSTLLILTDGVVTDMQKTVNAIVDAANLPLSIIIVGIGPADFKNMEILDADDTPLVSSEGVKMDRDIVQFVPYRDFAGREQGALAQAVLAELPDQVIDYYTKMKILPNKPTPAQMYGKDAFMAETTMSSIGLVQSGAQEAPPIYTFDEQKEQEQLPPGWEKKYDENSGKHFYIDHNTHQTSWTAPKTDVLESSPRTSGVGC